MSHYSQCSIKRHYKFADVSHTHIKWIPGVGCMTVQNTTSVLTLLFAYTMAVDLSSLVLNAYKLGFKINWLKKTSHGRSSFPVFIFRQGLYYYVVAWVPRVQLYLSPSYRFSGFSPILYLSHFFLWTWIIRWLRCFCSFQKWLFRYVSLESAKTNICLFPLL